MAAANALPRFNGSLFYRHMQGTLLSQSKLMSRNASVRKRAASWIAASVKCIQVGIDGGHMILLSCCMNPKLAISAADPCVAKSDTAPRQDIYTQASITCLNEMFPKRVQLMAGRPNLILSKHVKTKAQLLHIDGVSPKIYRTIGALRPVLDKDCLLLVTVQDLAKAAEVLKHLKLIGAIHTLLDSLFSSSGASGFFVARLKG